MVALNGGYADDFLHKATMNNFRIFFSIYTTPSIEGYSKSSPNVRLPFVMRERPGSTKKMQRCAPEQEDTGRGSAVSSPDIDSTRVKPLSTFSTIDTSDADTISLEHDHEKTVASPGLPSSPIIEAHGLGITAGSSAGSLYQLDPEELLFAASGRLSGYSSVQQSSLASSQFTVPDPLRSNPIETSDNTRKYALAVHPALRESGTQRTVDDKIGTELCGSPRRKRIRSPQRTDNGKVTGESDKVPSFLPLLDHTSGIQKSPGTNSVREEQASSIQPRLDDLQIQLADLNERLAGIAIKSNGQNEMPSHDDSTGEAIEQLQSQSSNQSSQLAAMQGQVNALTENPGCSHQNTTQDLQRLHTAVDGQHDNYGRLSHGWEGMRRELYGLKSSHQRRREQFDTLQRTPSNKPTPTEPSNLSTRPPHSEPYPPPTIPKKRPPPTNPQDEFTWYPGKKEPSLTSLISRLLPGAAPAEERRAASEAARQPITSTRVPVPHPVTGPSFDGLPPVQYRETAEVRTKHRIDYPRGCNWPGCEICRGQSRRRG